MLLFLFFLKITYSIGIEIFLEKYPSRPSLKDGTLDNPFTDIESALALARDQTNCNITFLDGNSYDPPIYLLREMWLFQNINLGLISKKGLVHIEYQSAESTIKLKNSSFFAYNLTFSPILTNMSQPFLNILQSTVLLKVLQKYFYFKILVFYP